jgi:hypothetical protein
LQKKAAVLGGNGIAATRQGRDYPQLVLATVTGPLQYLRTAGGGGGVNVQIVATVPGHYVERAVASVHQFPLLVGLTEVVPLDGQRSFPRGSPVDVKTFSTGLVDDAVVRIGIKLTPSWSANQEHPRSGHTPGMFE